MEDDTRNIVVEDATRSHAEHDSQRANEGLLGTAFNSTRHLSVLTIDTQHYILLVLREWEELCV